MEVDFFQLKRVSEAQRIFLEACPQGPLGYESVALLDATGRVLAEPVRSQEDLPGFDRSTVDGYAVRAADTFGASAALPAYLRIADDIPMGQAANRPLGPGECARIATGGMLPPGADAVVMAEHTDLIAGDEVGIVRPAAPGTNVIRRGEDCPAGGVLVEAGTMLRPQEVALLAHAGVTRVKVARRPRVAILSTGDELVPPDTSPAPGQIRESNSFALCGLVTASGAEPVLLGHAPDEVAAIRAKLQAGLAADVVLISGGSSVGVRDMTAAVLDELGPPGVLVHGVALKPAKPTILAVAGTKPVVGLPGNPVSAHVSFLLFVQPTIRRLLGMAPFQPRWAAIRARLSKNYPSAAGRVDVLRVALVERDGELWAEPVQGKSGLISTLTSANGMVIIEETQEGLTAGQWVDVWPI
ncbi:MAG: molybdopterin molybdotransferase MoeA [Firmicutes bacterium]|nr:molybdopterin molybdotransferase MoeA [Bacillota bacterium]